MKLQLNVSDYPLNSIEYKSVVGMEVEGIENPFSFENFSKTYLRTGKEERKDSDFDKSKFTIKLDDYKLYEFKNVTIDKYGILYDAGHTPIKESLNTYEDEDKFVERFGLKEFDSAKEIYLEKEPILFFDHFFSNFGHFVTEAFPRLFLVKELLQQGHKILLPPQAPSDILEGFQNYHQHVQACLDSLEITKENVIEIPEEGARFSKLIMPSHVKFRPDIVVPAITHLKNYYYDSSFEWNNPKIYISREDSKLRNIANNKDVELVLCKYLGFKKIIMKDISFKDKVNIMARALALVSPEGCSIINGIFMPQGSHILTLRPPVFPSFFIFLYSVFDQELQHQVCEFSTDNKSWYSGSIKVNPVVLFDKTINLLTKSSSPSNGNIVSLKLFRLGLSIWFSTKKILDQTARIKTNISSKVFLFILFVLRPIKRPLKRILKKLNLI